MNRFTEKTDDELVKLHTKGMALIEGVWDEKARRLCESAGKDRLCTEAVLSGKARSMLKRAEAFHADADVLAAEFAGVEMPFSGDR